MPCGPLQQYPPATVNDIRCQIAQLCQDLSRATRPSLQAHSNVTETKCGVWSLRGSGWAVNSQETSARKSRNWRDSMSVSHWLHPLSKVRKWVSLGWVWLWDGDGGPLSWNLILVFLSNVDFLLYRHWTILLQRVHYKLLLLLLLLLLSSACKLLVS